jgi:hypothetical protein
MNGRTPAQAFVDGIQESTAKRRKQETSPDTRRPSQRHRSGTVRRSPSLSRRYMRSRRPCPLFPIPTSSRRSSIRFLS